MAKQTRRPVIAQSFLARNWLILLVVAMVVGVLLYWTPEAPRPRVQQRANVGEVPADASAVVSVAEADRVTMLEMEQVIRTHPSSELRTRLMEWLRVGRVQLNNESAHTDALGMVAAVLYRETVRGPALTLAVSPVLFFGPQFTRARRQVMVYHEYIHLRQQIDGTIPATELRGTMRDHLTDTGIRWKLRAEFEAYEEECRLGLTFMGPGYSELCRRYAAHGRRALRESVVELHALLPMYRGHQTRVRTIGASIMNE
ncbi:MAG: hypothetical protein WCV84_00610 [Patescibacteria group bacterium]